ARQYGRYGYRKIALRPEQRNHVWSCDFVEDRTHDGRKYRMLNVLDEFTHECLAIRVARKLKAIDVIDVLSDLFILRGIPAHIRSDNGPEFLAKAVQDWIYCLSHKLVPEPCAPAVRAAPFVCWCLRGVPPRFTGFPLAPV